MADPKKLKAELRELKKEHGKLVRDYVSTKKKLWKAEERMERINIELRLIAWKKVNG